MSKRAGITAAFVFYGFLLVYFMYEVKTFHSAGSYTAFLHQYLYNIQKILLNVNLVVAILAYYMKTPVLNPEYWIRYGRDLSKVLFKEIIKRSTSMGVATFLLFLIPSVLYPTSLSDYLLLAKSVLLVFLYTFCWSVVEKVLYLKTGNLIIGLVSCAVLSLFVSMLHGNLVFENMLPGSGNGYMWPFVIVLAVFSIVSTILIMWIARRIECLA